MEYRKGPGGEPLSALGFGCMRFERKSGSVDLDAAQALLQTAVDAGVNYLDTAYIYAGNESALGKIFARTDLRDRVNLATKLPQYLIKTASAQRSLELNTCSQHRKCCCSRMEMLVHWAVSHCAGSCSSSPSVRR